MQIFYRQKITGQHMWPHVLSAEYLSEDCSTEFLENPRTAATNRNSMKKTTTKKQKKKQQKTKKKKTKKKRRIIKRNMHNKQLKGKYKFDL